MNECFHNPMSASVLALSPANRVNCVVQYVANYDIAQLHNHMKSLIGRNLVTSIVNILISLYIIC